MSKITINKKSNYTTIDNNIFKNKNLSLKAKGLLTTMLSLPDEWDYTVNGLCSILKDGKSSIQSALKELEENGYLVRVQTKDKSGKFSSADYTLYEIPLTEKPLTENPPTDNPSTGNQPQLNTNILNTNELNKDKENTKNKASTKVEVSYKAFSRSDGIKASRKLPYDYSKSQIDDFIKNKVNEILMQHSTEYQEEVKPISQIISYFYEKYFEVMGERHPIMSDAVYLGVVKKLLNPIDAIWESDTRLDVLGYEAMIDRFFATEYGEKSGNRTDYRIGYFFSDKVIENLYYRELY